MITIYNWDDTSGYVMVNQHGNNYKFNLYGEGKTNCFLASVYEYTGDDGKEYEQLQWFMNDESHCKTLLGLKKGWNGEKDNFLAEVTTLVIYKNKCPNWKKVVTMFADAFSELTIEIKEVE